MVVIMWERSRSSGRTAKDGSCCRAAMPSQGQLLKQPKLSKFLFDLPFFIFSLISQCLPFHFYFQVEVEKTSTGEEGGEEEEEGGVKKVQEMKKVDKITSRQFTPILFTSVTEDVSI
jgi:hypothetical protein